MWTVCWSSVIRTCRRARCPTARWPLTCGIDVQKRGFWYLVRAWMPTMASYVIDYGYLGSWDDVQALVFDTCYPVQGPDGSDVGERMPIWRACIDSGGTETEGVYTRTEEVYMWVRANGCGVVHACKGASRPQAAPVRWVVRERMPHNGRPIPGAAALPHRQRRLQDHGHGPHAQPGQPPAPALPCRG